MIIKQKKFNVEKEKFYFKFLPHLDACRVQNYE